MGLDLVSLSRQTTDERAVCYFGGSSHDQMHYVVCPPHSCQHNLSNSLREAPKYIKKTSLLQLVRLPSY